MSNYLVVLFKNKQRKRIIKKFVTLSRAREVYNSMISKSQDVIFEVSVENGSPCKYELGLIETKINQSSPVYMMDEYGRNVRVKLEGENASLLNVSPFKQEELIFDLQTKIKISSQELLKKYFKGDGLKMLSVLNNKIILQKDEEIFLFSLKNESECSRFIDSLSLYFFKIKRGDCLFIKDYSSAQRKYLYNLLESYGFDKKILYRKFTTYRK